METNRRLQLSTQEALPIFIHSMFRSGSTYLFNVFRRSRSGYYTYYEPFHEDLKSTHDELFTVSASSVPEKRQETKLNHPQLKKPYFFEYAEFRSELKDYFDLCFPYELFYLTPKDRAERLRIYVEFLIRRAKGRPVLSFCWSFFRSDWLHDNFDAIRIYSFRNPRDQFQSIQLTYSYFRAVHIMIAEASVQNTVFQKLIMRLGIVKKQFEHIQDQLNYYKIFPLSRYEEYFLFYSIWVMSHLNNFQKADCSIDMDQLSASQDYRINILAALSALGIDGLEFSDCRIRQRCFSEKDELFYSEIERKVLDFFITNCEYPEKNFADLPRYSYSDRIKTKDYLIDNLEQTNRETDLLLQEIRRLETVLYLQQRRFINPHALFDYMLALRSKIIKIPRSIK